MDDKMINSTKKADAPTVLSSTLSDMEEWNINKLNEPTGKTKKD